MDIVTIKNINEEMLDQLATKGATTLGMFERVDLIAFKKWAKVNNSKWDFLFKASKVDREVGRIALVFGNDAGKAIIFKGRVKRLTDKFHWIKKMPGKAEEIIEMLNDHPQLRDERVRDFLLANRRNHDLVRHFNAELEIGPRDRILSALVKSSCGDNKVLARDDKARARQLAHMRQMYLLITKILDNNVVFDTEDPEHASDENYALKV